MDKKIIIAIAGEIASGKDTVAQYFMESFSAVRTGYSDILKDILDRLSLPTTRPNYANLAEALRNNFGGDILSLGIMRRVEQSGAQAVILDGIRKKEEVAYFRKMPTFFLVFVDTTLENRYHRLKKRGEKADDFTKTFEEFVEDNKHGAENTIYELKDPADFVIDNNATKEDLERQMNEILVKIKKR